MAGGRSFATDAVLLRQIPHGEADRIVTLYTRSHGKVSAVARGARKSRKRFGAALALFVLGEAELREKTTSDLFGLERFDARRDYSSLAGDVVAMAHASYATELVRELTVPRQAGASLLDILVDLYAVAASSPPRASTLRAFELMVLEEIGLRPVLDRCVVCHRDSDLILDAAGAVLSPHRGGVVCPDCARGIPRHGARLLPGLARRRLDLLRAGTLAQAAALPPAPPEVETAAREAMHAVVHSHLSAPLKSVAFLEKLRGT